MQMLFFSLCTYVYVSCYAGEYLHGGRSRVNLLCCSQAPHSWHLTIRLGLLASDPREPPGLKAHATTPGFVCPGPREGTQIMFAQEAVLY